MDNETPRISISFEENSRFGKRHFRLKNGCLEISYKTDNNSFNDIYYTSELSHDVIRTKKRHYGQIARICAVFAFIALLIASLVIQPQDIRGMLYTLTSCLAVVFTLIYPGLYFLWQKTEVAQFYDTSGVLAFEIRKERAYADEFESFVQILINYIENKTTVAPAVAPVTHEEAPQSTPEPFIQAAGHDEQPQRPDALVLTMIDIVNETRTTDLPVDGPHPATAEYITNCILGLPDASKVLHIERNEDEWLEIGWIKRGFVFRENLWGVCYYSNSPIKEAEDAAEFVAEYQKNSVCEPKDWFRVNGGQATYDFVTDRFWFEVWHKRYPVTSTLAQCLYIGAHLVLAIQLFFVTVEETGAHDAMNPLHLIFGTMKMFFYMVLFAGLMMIKFDFRAPRKKGKHSYNSE